MRREAEEEEESEYWTRLNMLESLLLSLAAEEIAEGHVGEAVLLKRGTPLSFTRLK